MKNSLTKSITVVLGLGALVLILSAPALATPPEDVPFWAEIMNRLNQIEAKIDAQSTDLRGVTQNWDKKLDSNNGDANGCDSDRFTCLWPDSNGTPTAVRDNETGVVWDRDPDMATTRRWWNAIGHCTDREVGGRKGWSLPMPEQLATLVDTSNSNPALPTGHPFRNVQSALYWSASTRVERPTDAWGMHFGDGRVRSDLKSLGSSNYTWCARGGQAYDGQEVLNATPAP